MKKEFNCKFESEQLKEVPEEKRSFKIILLEHTKDGMQFALAPSNFMILLIAPLIIDLVQISLMFLEHIRTIEEIDDMKNNIFTKEDSIYLFNLMHEVDNEITLEKLEKDLESALYDEDYEEACIIREKLQTFNLNTK